MPQKYKTMGRNYKSEETKARESAHHFGANGGNKIGNPSAAAKQREFYRWVESVATERDLLDYAADESNPAARRRFVRALFECKRIQDFFDLTNQTHGKPKEQVEILSDAETAAAIRAEWAALYGAENCRA